MFQNAGPDLQYLRPGMELRADIILREHESCFVVPSSAVTLQGAMNVVHVQEDEDFAANPSNSA